MYLRVYVDVEQSRHRVLEPDVKVQVLFDPNLTKISDNLNVSDVSLSLAVKSSVSIFSVKRQVKLTCSKYISVALSIYRELNFSYDSQPLVNVMIASLSWTLSVPGILLILQKSCVCTKVRKSIFPALCHSMCVSGKHFIVTQISLKLHKTLQTFSLSRLY